jgi:hypothetical protein
MRAFLVIPFLWVAMVSPASGQSATDQIRSLRAQSNAAIARHDVEGVVSHLDVDYQVTVGSGALRQDRAAEPERWAATFAQADDLIFAREPESIEVSASRTRAAEIGVWTGSWTTAEGRRSLGGSYAAHWVLTSGRWKLRSELFVRLRCEGAGCS